MIGGAPHTRDFSRGRVQKYPVSAEVAAVEIDKIKDDLNKENIAPEYLLDASRAEKAPLHCCFEWNDSVAAEKYRVDQAKELIRAIRVEIIKDVDKTPVVIRPFINVSDGNDKGYFVSIKTALENKDYRINIFNNAAEDLKTFKARYGMYSELFEVCTAIDKFVATLK